MAHDDPEHDYTSVLTELARAANLDVSMTVEDLDEYLHKTGWRPPLDTLAKWGARNEWCRAINDDQLSDLNAPPGLTVLIVREAAAKHVGRITELIRESGLDIVSVRPLTDEEVTRATEELRGGNWGRGPWARSGGPPAAIVVATDPMPTTPWRELAELHPGIDNARLVEIKERIRSWWNEQQPRSAQSNVLHTSDSAVQAAHYLQVVNPALFEDVAST